MNRQTFGNNRVRGIILSFAFAIVLCGVPKVKWYDVTRNKVNKPRSHSTRYPPPVNKVSPSYEYLRQTLRKTRQINSILPLLSLQLTQLLRIHATHVNIQSICTKFLITLYILEIPRGIWLPVNVVDTKSNFCEYLFIDTNRTNWEWAVELFIARLIIVCNYLFPYQNNNYLIFLLRKWNLK